MIPNKRIRLIVADDHEVYIDGLTLLFSGTGEIDLVAAAGNGKQLIECTQKYRPDVILTDLSMPLVDGITAIRLINEAPDAPAIIAISTFDHNTLIADAIDAGAMGFVVKNAENWEIIEAIKKVYAGFAYYCKSASGQIMKTFAGSRFDPYTIAIHYKFDALEKEIIRMVCLEKTNKEIGAAICLTERRVEGIRNGIMKKMQAKSVAGFTTYAIKNKLFNIENLR